MLLERDNLRARAVEPEDAVPMWEMETDKDQWRFNGMTAPFSMLNLREYANTYEADPFAAGQLRLMVELDGAGDESPEIVGMVDLYDISAQNRTAFVGIYVRPGFRSKGYGRKMVAMIAEYAFRILNLKVLAAKVVEGNEESKALFEDCGFELAGTMRSWIETYGERRDLYIYQNMKL